MQNDNAKFKISESDKIFLLNSARRAIEAKLAGRSFEVDETEISDALKQKCGTFVTLTIGGKLRGCIGHVASVQELYKDVIENAQASAFSDPRFSPLTKEEFEKINIEISILGPSRKLEVESLPSLLNYLEKNRPGVIIKSAGRSATFLPQVWQDLPSAEAFLSHLCLKAGLTPDVWTKDINLEIYNVEKIDAV